MTSVADPDDLFEEVAFVAYHFGWSHEEVLSLPHWERRRWCDEISTINERMNEPQDAQPAPDTGNQSASGSTFIDGDGEGMILQNTLEEE